MSKEAPVSNAEDSVVNPALAQQTQNDITPDDDFLNNIVGDGNRTAIESLPSGLGSVQRIIRMAMESNDALSSHNLQKYGVTLAIEAYDDLLGLNTQADSDLSALESLRESCLALESMEFLIAEEGLGSRTEKYVRLHLRTALESVSMESEPWGDWNQSDITTAVGQAASKLWDGIVDVSKKAFSTLEYFFKGFYKSIMSLAVEARALKEKLNGYHRDAKPKADQIEIQDANYLLPKNGAGCHEIIEMFANLNKLHKTTDESYYSACEDYFTKYYETTHEIFSNFDSVKKNQFVDGDSFSIAKADSVVSGLLAKWLYPSDPLDKAMRVLSSTAVGSKVGMHITGAESALSKVNARFEGIVKNDIAKLNDFGEPNLALPGGKFFGSDGQKSWFGFSLPKLHAMRGLEISAKQMVDTPSIPEIHAMLDQVETTVNVFKSTEKARYALFDRVNAAHNRYESDMAHDGKRATIDFLSSHLASKRIHANLSSLMRPIRDLNMYSFKCNMHLVGFCKKAMRLY